MSRVKIFMVIIVLIAAFSFIGCLDFGDDDDPSGACVYNSGFSNTCRNTTKSECSGHFHEDTTCEDLLDL